MALSHRKIACVASVSVRFRSKERGTRVKDRAKNGVSKRAGRGLFHFSRCQNRGSIESGGRAILRIMQHAGIFKKIILTLNINEIADIEM